MGAVTFAQPVQLPPAGPEERLARPAAADLLRVVASFMVAWFHIWQQTWIGAGRWDHLPRTGAVWVDVLILLSAFCLFLPYANAWAAGEPLPPLRPLAFYRRRAVRILPSYYVCLAASLAMVLYREGWSGHLAKDVLAHLTLTQMAFPESYVWAKLNGVTWTLSLFAVLYAVFPWLARALVCRPVQMFTAMLAVQWGYSRWAAAQYGSSDYAFLFNQLPAFCGVLAVGFAAAMALAFWGRSARLQTPGARVAFTLLGCGAVGLVLQLIFR